MNGIAHSPSGGLVDRVAGLVRTLVNPKRLSAILKHLRHERQVLELSVFVQRAQNFFLASYFYEIASSNTQMVVDRPSQVLLSVRNLRCRKEFRRIHSRDPHHALLTSPMTLPGRPWPSAACSCNGLPSHASFADTTQLERLSNTEPFP